MRGLRATVGAHRRNMRAVRLLHATLDGREDGGGEAIRLLREAARLAPRGPLRTPVAVGREALRRAHQQDPRRGIVLSNLADALAGQARATARTDPEGAAAMVRQALDAAREAAAGTPDGHPECARLLSNLGVVMSAAFRLAAADISWDEVVATHRRALAAAPAGHPERHPSLANLGSALITIGTLWPVVDAVALDVARRVYRAVAADGTADGVAHALHHALRALREAWPTHPSAWAAHLHSGA